MASGAALVTVFDTDPVPCNADATSPADRIDVVLPLVKFGGSVERATVECNGQGGVPVGPVGDDDTELVCRTVDY